MRKYTAMLLGLSVLFVGSAYADEPAVQQTTDGMLNEASEGVKSLENVISEGSELLSEAKAESDVAKIDCINSNLVNARGFLSVVQNAQANLSDAIARNDSESQKHHYKLVQLGVSKGNEISAKMHECSTGVVGVSGTTVQETIRVCSVEPCLGGEQFYEPSKTHSTANTGKLTADDLDESGNILDVDASAYL